MKKNSRFVLEYKKIMQNMLQNDIKLNFSN